MLVADSMQNTSDLPFLKTFQEPERGHVRFVRGVQFSYRFRYHTPEASTALRQVPLTDTDARIDPRRLRQYLVKNERAKQRQTE